MKNALLIPVLAAAAFAAGCKPSTATSTNTATTPPPAAIASALPDPAKPEYNFAQKGEFLADMQAKVAELNRGFDELSAKIGTASDAVKDEAKPKFVSLREKSAQLGKQVESAQSATAATWTDVRAEALKSYAAVQADFVQTRAWAAGKSIT